MGILICGTTLRLLRRQDQRCPASLPGRWRVAHYDADGETHVVLHRISASGSKVLDEHAVAALRSDDAKYGGGPLSPLGLRKRPSPENAGEGRFLSVRVPALPGV